MSNVPKRRMTQLGLHIAGAINAPPAAQHPHWTGAKLEDNAEGAVRRRAEKLCKGEALLAAREGPLQVWIRPIVHIFRGVAVMQRRQKSYGEANV